MLDIRGILEKIPKSELHVHLRGAMPVETFAMLLNKYAESDIWGQAGVSEKAAVYRRYGNIEKFMRPQRWSLDQVKDLFAYKGFDHFIATYGFTGYYIRDILDFRILVRSVLENLRRQNIVYAEVTISIIEYLRQGIRLEEIRDCLDEMADFPGIRVQWIIDLVRDTGSETALNLLKQIIGLKCKSIAGITLGGREYIFPAKDFSEVYHTAREHGLRLSVHAGEACGPESIWDAVNFLKIDRIGHGVRAAEDVLLIAHLAEGRIPLEVCPTSNIRTGVFSCYEEHPAGALLNAGVIVTVNSDDPTFFNTTLVDEYIHIYRMGVKIEDIFQIICNGFKHAFLSSNEIEAYVRELDIAWKQQLRVERGHI